MKNSISGVLWCVTGLFLVSMGMYFVIRPDATMVSVAFLMGLALLVSGCADVIVYMLDRRQYIASGWLSADGLVDLIAGAVFMGHRLFAAALLPYLFGLWAMIAGGVKCVNALIYRREGAQLWGWMLTVGLTMVLIGAGTMLVPSIGAVVISIFVAVVLIAQGLMAFIRGVFCAHFHANE